VRRVFAIDVKRSRVMEWSTETSGWRELDASGHIGDPALEVPLPIEAILHAAKADDAIARALLARHNPTCADAHELWAMTGEVRLGAGSSLPAGASWPLDISPPAARSLGYR
jgi:hypothetical protein